MARLKNRQIQIPYGLRYYQAETKWSPRDGSSFQGIVESVIAHRRSQPYLSNLHKWSLDPIVVANEVDAFNSAICERMGWRDYITVASLEPPTPRFKPQSQSTQNQLSVAAAKAKKVWQGVKSINDWIVSGEPEVPMELSDKRAHVCSQCPQNGDGGIEQWFTKPASEVVQKQFEKLADKKLSTSLDEKLGVCKVCLCPLKLTVHVPLKFKLAHMGLETKRELHPACWVINES